MMPPTLTPGPSGPAGPTARSPEPSLHQPSPREARLREAAVGLEASFLKEMLGAAGLGRVPGLGGGPGEEQFASFLLDAQARRMAEAGGIGLASSIMAALQRQAGEQPNG
jgi:Rod binding domain-containing protein